MPKKRNPQPQLSAHAAVSCLAPKFKLTDEQQAVVDPLAKLEKQVQTLGGLAGSGKTTVVSFLQKKLPGFACCAFTGKAADVLRSKGVDASTIHSLIYVPQETKGKKGPPVFVKKPSIPVRGIIVDEASMVGRDVYADLISYNLPIIFVGDHGQLEPVGEDLYLMANPDYRLETIHRNAGDIAKFAHHLRSGQSSKTYGECEKVIVIPKPQCAYHLLEVDQIICAKNATRVAINKYIRQLKGIERDYPIIGDRVISLRNSRRHSIFNGSQGTVYRVGDRKLTVVLSNGARVALDYHVDTFNREKVDHELDGHPFDYAYAVTCHKAQGSEWMKVLVLEQVCGGWDHKRWAYTAASRAKEKLIWVTDP
jgi:exodeoxyribonuclease-5